MNKKIVYGVLALALGCISIFGICLYAAADQTAPITQIASLVSPTVTPIDAAPVVARPSIQLTRYSTCDEFQKVRDIYGFTEMIQFNSKHGWSLTNFIVKIRSCGLF